MSILISTKGRYATRVMIELTELYGTGNTSVRDISERTKLSPKYLESIIAVLTRNGLVKSARGVQGGYSLVRDPSEYTIGEIVRAVEGESATVNCKRDSSEPCPKADTCSTARLWCRIDTAIFDILDNTTLKDLHEWNRTGDVLHIDNTCCPHEPL